MSTQPLQQNATLVPCELPESVDETASAFSQLHLSPQKPNKIHRLPIQPSRYPADDRIGQLILNVLFQDLNHDMKNRRLLSNHSCFNLARQYAQRWGISNTAIESHITLACGYLNFPVLLLLNPPPGHEKFSFDEMLERCPTLIWIRKILEEIGLELADVIILDMCTLLDDSRIGKMDADTKNRALFEAYEVTWQMLALIKPNIIISCQCQTRNESWGGGEHVAARQLCSSMKGAEAKEVNQTCVINHIIHVIQGYHPSGFLHYRNHSDPGGKYLAKLLRKVYLPCAIWKCNCVVDSLDKSINAIAKLLAATMRTKLRLKTLLPAANGSDVERIIFDMDLLASLEDMRRYLSQSLSGMNFAKDEVKQIYKGLVQT